MQVYGGVVKSATPRVCGIAARISMKKGKGDEAAVTRQVQDAAKTMAALGWVLGATPGAPHDPKNPAEGTWPAAHYVDNDVRISGGHPKGSQFHRILADIQTGAIDSVVATQGDRLWRNRRETAETLDLFEELGVWVAVNGQAYNCQDPSHVAMLEQLGVFAQLETKRMGQRIDRAAYERARAGKVDKGPVPFGCKPAWSDDMPRKFLGWQRDPGPWDRMRQAVAEITDGVLSHAEIARRLNADGYRTPRGNPWDGGTLRQYLLSPWVRGEVVYTGPVPDGEPPFTPVRGTNFEALVSPDEWAVLSGLLSARAGTRPARRTDAQHLLTGFARCGRVLDASDGRGQCGVCGHHLTLTGAGALHDHSPARGGFYDPGGERCPGSGRRPERTFPHEREGQVCGAVLSARRGTSNGQPVYCCPAWPRGCGKLARNEADTDRWVTLHLFHWLSGPDGAYDRAVASVREQDPAVAGLHAEQAADQHRLARIDADWNDTDGRAYGCDINRKIAEEDRIRARIATRQAVIDRTATRQRAAVITERGAGLETAWEDWDLARKRAVLAMFLDRVDVLPARRGPIPFDLSKVTVISLPGWAADAPAGSLDPDPAAAAAKFTDPVEKLQGRHRSWVPARDRITGWLKARPGGSLTAVDIMELGLADSRDVKAARLTLWQMEKDGELAITVPGVRGHTPTRYGLPARKPR
jgi:DNA invertase Pin-like site-specific DNA recombinase